MLRLCRVQIGMTDTRMGLEPEVDLITHGLGDTMQEGLLYAVSQVHHVGWSRDGDKRLTLYCCRLDLEAGHFVTDTDCVQHVVIGKKSLRAFGNNGTVIDLVLKEMRGLGWTTPDWKVINDAD